MISIPKKRYQEAIDLVNTSYRSALEFQRPLFLNFNEYYQIYRSVREESKQNYAGRAKLFIPYVFSTIETIVPRLVGEKPKVEAVPREPTDIQGAKVNSQILDYQWDILKMKEKLKMWTRQALIYGVGIIKLSWEFKQKGSNYIDKPCAELVDLFDYFIDPNATTIDNARYSIQRAERDLAVLKANSNYVIPTTLESTVKQDEYKVMRDSILGLTKPKEKQNKNVEVLEYWGLFDIDGKGTEEECLLVVANQTTLIRCEKNPYEHKQKPFIHLNDVQVPFTVWSIGEIEQLKSLAYELNDVRNQRMDNVTLILNRMWKVNKNADVDEEDLVSQAGQIVHTDDMNGIEPLTTPDVTSSAYNEETMIKQDMQLVSGVSDYSRGMGSSSNKTLANSTATGIMLLQEAGNARFKYKLDNIEDALVRFGKQLLALNQQFMDTETKIRISGVNGTMWVDVNPDNIQGEYDIKIEAGSTQPMNKSIRRAEARELLQAVLPLAPSAPMLGLDLKYFIKYLLQTYDLTNIEEAFPPQAGLQIPGGLPPGADQSNFNVPGVPQVGGMEPAKTTSNSQNPLGGATVAQAGGFIR
jgi:hypothetical protein